MEIKTNKFESIVISLVILGIFGIFFINSTNLIVEDGNLVLGESTTTEETTTEDETAPEEDTTVDGEETAAEETAPEEDTTVETISEETTVDETAPAEETTVDETVSEETTSAQATPTYSNILSVYTIEDSGPGSFRAAIEAANAMSGPNDIQFNLSGSSPFIIDLQALLPPITGSINTIYGPDGQTVIIRKSPYFSGDPRYGLKILSNENTIKNLGISGFDTQIHIEGTGFNKIENVSLGDIDGVSLGISDYGDYGIKIINSNITTIKNNSIKGFSEAGILIELQDPLPGAVDTVRNKILQNTIYGNSKYGIAIYGGYPLIDNNIISNNSSAGIFTAKAKIDAVPKITNNTFTTGGAPLIVKVQSTPENSKTILDNNAFTYGASSLYMQDHVYGAIKLTYDTMDILSGAKVDVISPNFENIPMDTYSEGYLGPQGFDFHDLTTWATFKTKDYYAVKADIQNVAPYSFNVISLDNSARFTNQTFTHDFADADLTKDYYILTKELKERLSTLAMNTAAPAASDSTDEDGISTTTYDVEDLTVDTAIEETAEEETAEEVAEGEEGSGILDDLSTLVYDVGDLIFDEESEDSLDEEIIDEDIKSESTAFNFNVDTESVEEISYNVENPVTDEIESESSQIISYNVGLDDKIEMESLILGNDNPKVKRKPLPAREKVKRQPFATDEETLESEGTGVDLTDEAVAEEGVSTEESGIDKIAEGNGTSGEAAGEAAETAEIADKKSGSSDQDSNVKLPKDEKLLSLVLGEKSSAMNLYRENKMIAYGAFGLSLLFIIFIFHLIGKRKKANNFAMNPINPAMLNAIMPGIATSQAISPAAVSVPAIQQAVSQAPAVPYYPVGGQQQPAIQQQPLQPQQLQPVQNAPKTMADLYLEMLNGQR